MDKIENQFWPHLIRNEPTVEELTQQEYENSMGIIPDGTKSKKGQDVKQPVGQGKPVEAGAPVPVGIESLKREIIAEILRRGTDISEKDLKKKNKQQLLELL